MILNSLCCFIIILDDIIKQADYVLANFKCIKEKLVNITETENYKSVKKRLKYEWKKYNLLLKAFKALSVDVLYFNGVSYYILFYFIIKFISNSLIINFN